MPQPAPPRHLILAQKSPLLPQLRHEATPNLYLSKILSFAQPLPFTAVGGTGATLFPFSETPFDHWAHGKVAPKRALPPCRVLHTSLVHSQRFERVTWGNPFLGQNGIGSRSAASRVFSSIHSSIWPICRRELWICQPLMFRDAPAIASRLRGTAIQSFPFSGGRKRLSSGFLVEIWVSQGFQFSLRGDGDAVSVVLGRRDPGYAWLHVVIPLSQAASVAGGADVVELASVLAACEAPRYVCPEHAICDVGFHIICEAQRCVPRKERGDEVVDRRRRLKCPTTIKSRGVGNSASLGGRSLILVDRVRERVYRISGLRGP